MVEKLFISVGKNRINFEKVEWFTMYDSSDVRIVGKVGNTSFVCYNTQVGFNSFNPKKAFEQSYLDSFEFKPLSSNFTSLVKIEMLEWEKSRKLLKSNNITGVFE